MKTALFFYLVFLFIVTSSCSSKKTYGPNNSPYKPFVNAPLNINPYEDEFIKVEMVGSDKAKLHLKKANKILGISKIQEDTDPNRIGQFEFYSNNFDAKYFMYFSRNSCGKFMAYVPNRGIVCWNHGNATGGIGRLVFDENRETNYPHMWRAVQIHRTGIQAGEIIANKTVLADVFNDPKAKVDKNIPLYTAKASLYEAGKVGAVKTWENIHDFRGTRKSTFSPNFLRSTNSHLQIALKQENQLLEVITLDNELKEKVTHKDVFKSVQKSDEPQAHHFRSYSYLHHLDKVNYTVTAEDERLDPAQFSYSLLVKHPTQQNWFVFLEPNGDISLPKDSIGMIPIIVNNQSFFDLNHGSYSKNVRDYQTVHGWMVAYLDSAKKVVWGWGSPELSWVSGPKWKDFYFHERVCIRGDSKKSSLGCGLVHYISGDKSVYNLGSNPKTEPYDYTPFVSGPFIVAQDLEGLWQVYTQQAFLFDSNQKNLATYNRPNNFSNAIPKMKTDKEAITKAEEWLVDYLDKMQKRVRARFQVIAAQNGVLWDEKMKRAVEATIAKNKAEETARWKNQMEVEQRQDAIRDAQRANARATAMSAIESGSFTNRLRNISSGGSSSRATQSLETMTNKLKKAQGKGY
jgi:hypothetical protein